MLPMVPGLRPGLACFCVVLRAVLLGRAGLALTIVFFGTGCVHVLTGLAVHPFGALGHVLTVGEGSGAACLARAVARRRPLLEDVLPRLALGPRVTHRVRIG